MNKSPRHLARAPLLYRLTAALIRRRIRGSSFLHRRLSRMGLFDCVARFPLAAGLDVYAPLFTDNVWDAEYLRSYEADFVNALSLAASSLPGPVRYIDCGASFGLFALRFLSSCPAIASAVCFEPNPAMHAVLALNLAQLPIPTEARPAAVCDWRGAGELRQPAHDASPDAAYLAPVAGGPVAVAVIDDIPAAPGSVVVKIDVEGGELAVIRGGLGTLARAERFVVAFEAHPLVVARTGVDPTECLRLLRTVRACSVQVAEHPTIALDPDRPFFDQVLSTKDACNVVCTSL